MQRLLKELEIAEEQLIGKDYKIEIIKTFEDSILGIFRIQNEAYGFNFNCNTKSLIVGEEEKSIQWLKDIIKCYNLYQNDKIELAKKNDLYHDILIKSKDFSVRKVIAKITTNQKHLEILARDKEWFVREVVAKRGYCHDILVDDNCWSIRDAVAKTTTNNKYLEILSKDINFYVRETVAKRGYGLDVLCKSTGDGSTIIKQACKDFMQANGIKDMREYKRDKEKWYEFARTNIIKG